MKVTQTVNDLAEVNSDEEVTNRIMAFLISCEWLGLNEFRSADYNEGDEDGCGLSYWSKLMEQRKDFMKYSGQQPMLFTLLVDRKIRRKVAELMWNKRAKFPTFKVALAHVLKEFRFFWNDARDEAMRGSVDHELKESAAPSTPRTEKRPREEPSSAEKTAQETLKKLQERKKLLNNKKREKRKAKTAAAQSGGSQGQDKAASAREPLQRQSSSKGSGKGKDRVPAEVFNKVKEMAQRKKKCVFFNVGKCNFGDQCKDVHACCQCGGGHAFTDRH